MKKKTIICLILAMSSTVALFGCESKSKDIEETKISTETNFDSSVFVDGADMDNNNQNNEDGSSSNNQEKINSANKYSEEVHNKMLDHYNKVYAKGLDISNEWNDGEHDQLEERESRYSNYKELIFSNLEHEDAVWENYAVTSGYVDAHGFDDDKSKVSLITLDFSYCFKEDLDIAKSPLKEILEFTLPNTKLDYDLINSQVKNLPNTNKRLPQGETIPYSVDKDNYYYSIDAEYARDGGCVVTLYISVRPGYFE